MMHTYVNPMDQTTAKQMCGDTTRHTREKQKLGKGAMKTKPTNGEHETYLENAQNLAWNQT